MLKKYKINLLFCCCCCCLFYNNLISYGNSNKDTTKIAIPLNYVANKHISLAIPEDDNILENCLYLNEIDNQIVANLLTKILNQPDFLLPNKNWLAIKLFFMAIIPLSASVNNLGIAINNDITFGILLITQFTIPLNILNACHLLDKLKIHYEQGIKNIINSFKQNIAKTVYQIVTISLSIYLAYLSTLIDTQTSGNAYSWIFSKFTNSKSTLNAAYHLGYTLNLLSSLALLSVFFFNLMNEIFHKTGIGYLLHMTPSLKYNEKELNYYHYINNLKNITGYNNPEDAINQSTAYLTNNNLNTVLDIANLQLHCSEKNYHEKSIINIYINAFKFCFIISMAVFCAETFRQIFSSKLLLKDFIEDYANRTSNGGYSFLLNNTKMFTCDSIDNCISTIDINAIDIQAVENKSSIIFKSRCNYC